MYSLPTADFISTSLNGALSAAGSTATIGTGLNLPATNGILQIDNNSTTAVGVDNGPETVSYATYTAGTGALTGLVRGLAGTTGVAHANAASVSSGPSTLYMLDAARVMNRQDIAVNTVITKQITQIGYGYIAGSVATLLQAALTFPVAFDSPPIITLSYLGRVSGVPTGVGGFTVGAQDGSAAMANVSTTGGTVDLWLNENASASFNYGYSWIAIGPKA